MQLRTIPGNCRVLFLLTLLLVTGVSETVANDNQVKFLWALVARQGQQSTGTLTAINKEIRLQSGDHFKMLVEYQSPCSIYVLFKSADGEIALLYPPQLGTQQLSALKQQHYIPPGEDWFTLDENIGRERLFLLASKQPLKRVEELIKAYQTAPAEMKSSVADELFNSIKQLRKQHTQLSSSAERPVIIGGTFRGIKKKETSDQTLSTLATIIRVDEFFYKSFTIDHF